ncbi:MAG: hypothetical protein JNM57_06175 [Cyclobacteriaceae bacterium]|nr:hypothetical protein [Cyclobacteriaceae bacterium]
MKINYYRAIESLISFKERIPLIMNRKNEPVLNYLKTIELNYENDDVGVPDISKICDSVKLPRNKVYPILYESYLALLESLTTKPHTISDCVHAIYVHSHDEYSDSKNKEFKERESAREFWGEFRLPVTPRLGESISLDFVEFNTKYNRGIVTEVHHEIRSDSQRIVIYVHPFRNYYWQWDKLKKEHNHREQWMRRIQESRDQN